MLKILKMRKVVLLAVLAAAAVSVSCGNSSSDVPVKDLEYEKICGIDQSKVKVGYLNALAIPGDGGFILGTDKDVTRYSIDGVPTGSVGRSGRAFGEYMMPMQVRTDGDKVYVWSAMTLAFLVYDSSGNLIDTCPYESALHDFLPFGDKIYIFTAGLRSSDIIDIYDIPSRKITASLTATSEAHKAISTYSICPMAIYDGALYYMSRDKLEVYRYAIDGGNEPEKILEFTSETFNVPEVPDAKSLKSDRQRSQDFFDESSYVVAIVPLGERHVKVLTSEGKYYRENGEFRKDKRFYSVYDIRKGSSRKISSFHADVLSASTSALKGSDLYFILRTVSEDTMDEDYALCRASL